MAPAEKSGDADDVEFAEGVFDAEVLVVEGELLLRASRANPVRASLSGVEQTRMTVPSDAPERH
jgi:hypothetical protein